MISEARTPGDQGFTVVKLLCVLFLGKNRSAVGVAGNEMASRCRSSIRLVVNANRGNISDRSRTAPQILTALSTQLKFEAIVHSRVVYTSIMRTSSSLRQCRSGEVGAAKVVSPC